MRGRRKFGVLVAVLAVVFAVLTSINIGQARSVRPAERGPITAHSAASGSGAPASASRSSGTPGGGGVLIVYFSRSGSHYGGRNFKVGNTAHVAQFIHQRVGGDLYQIVPAVPYPEDYDQTVEQARKEQEDGVHPKIAGEQPDTDRYSTIFLGYPIWWGEQPMIVQTFMQDHNLNGKTVIPFTTDEGSGWGNSLDVLKQYYPQARILDGFEKRGNDVADDLDGTQRQVNDWLEGLGY